ncbi:hypothetical protein [Mesorhizobium australafricanum]|uniref:Uncharacterized protein n=1 Tax=Mesorhizobium australafricanum TaxID=3072311 RepID=A0ABU4WPY6_9HYPH|nr:hypothetical protein [Mesorhizobium sp. VK3E]MDX8438088.1 hypothetical protein [Mesorhizobium sp. VK3E]
MKTASRTLQILALSACFAAQAHGTITMPGVRQAMRTIDGSSGQNVPAAMDYTVSGKPARS